MSDQTAFVFCHLVDTNFSGATLREVDFSGSNLAGSQFDGRTYELWLYELPPYMEGRPTTVAAWTAARDSHSKLPNDHPEKAQKVSVDIPPAVLQDCHGGSQKVGYVTISDRESKLLGSHLAAGSLLVPEEIRAQMLAAIDLDEHMERRNTGFRLPHDSENDTELRSFLSSPEVKLNAKDIERPFRVLYLPETDEARKEAEWDEVAANPMVVGQGKDAVWLDQSTLSAFLKALPEEAPPQALAQVKALREKVSQLPQHSDEEIKSRAKDQDPSKTWEPMFQR